MRTVIHILTDKNIGGAGRWLLNYLAWYDRSRFLVKVVLPPDSALVPQVEALGVSVLPLEGMAEASWDKPSLAPMTQLFRREKPDIVHTHASLTARIAARKAGVPVIIATKHCMEGPPNPLKNLLRGWINRRYATRIIAISDAVAESLKAGGTNERQVVRIYNGVPPCPSPAPEEQEAFRARFGMDRDHLWVGLAARLEEVKDIPTFLATAKLVCAQREDIRFAVAGAGSLEAQLKAQAAELGDKLVFTGFLAQPAVFFSLLDINAITSRQEALCLSILEGMALGVPAVGTDTGGVSEIIRPGRTGLLAPVGDAPALARCIIELADDPEKRRCYGENAAAMVRETFSAQAMAEQLEALYEALAQRKE